MASLEPWEQPPTWTAALAEMAPVVFGLVYLAAMTLLLAVTRTWIPCLLLGFIWPAPALPVMRGWPTVGIIAALVAVIWYGHRKIQSAATALGRGTNLWLVRVLSPVESRLRATR